MHLKEKFYIYLGPFALLVGILRVDGTFHEYRLTEGQMLAIPSGCEHYVKYLPDEDLPCQVIVISSSQDGKDIQWEDAADQLCKNEHLMPTTMG